MINEQNKNSWCVNAFHALSGNNDGSTKLCCMYDDDIVETSVPDPHYVLGVDSIDTHFKHPVFEIVRADLDAGVRHERCHRCWEEEDAGRKSKRMRDNEKYINRLDNSGTPYVGLSYFELNLGNTCNLSCRTCAPQISSGWMKESHEAIAVVQNISYKDYAQSLKKFHMSYDEDSKFWDDLKSQLANIKQFDFYGGEPFMSKKMWEVLKIAQEMGVSKDIELHYNTNGTHLPIEDMKAWKDFKSVNISFSIDGIGEQFEYMRYPAVWNEVDYNMRKFHEIANEYGNIDLSWCITLSVTNIYYTPEILDYYYDNYFDKGFGMYLNLVHGPTQHNIGILPDNIKEKVEEKLNAVPADRMTAWQHIPGVINFMKQRPYDHRWFEEFLKVTESSDQYRDQNFKNTFKEYGELF